MSRHLYLTSEVISDLEKAANLSETHVESIVQYLVTAGTLPEIEETHELAQQLALSVETLVDVLAVLSYVRSQMDQFCVSDEEVPRELVFALRDAGKLEAAKKVDPGTRLGQLLSSALLRDGPIARARKTRRLTSNLIPTAYRFETFLDLRPNFAPDRKSVRELVPVVILRVRLKQDIEHAQSIHFQFDLRGYERLRSALDDLDSKIDRLSASPRLPDISWKKHAPEDRPKS